MSEDLNKLRELAESLQAGSAGFVRSRDFLNARHDFIDAANPAVILDLLSRLQAAEERAEKVEGALVKARAGLQISAGWANRPDRQNARAIIKSGLEAIRVALREPRAALKTGA